jgi:hypothetical protein
MEDKQKKILEKIISLGGDCLDHKLCEGCPFRTKCLPEFVTGKPMSKSQRLFAALDSVTHEALFGGQLEEEY